MKDFTAGSFIRHDTYQAFMPTVINRRWTFSDPTLLEALSRADQALGRLDTFSELVDFQLYVKMHTTKEATLSSRIEGTRTNIEEALLTRPAISLERRDDWEEVNNYLAALQHALAIAEELPFSSRFIRQIHGVLMRGVRGEHKSPGEYRRSQNWIGGTSPSNARFVPPAAQHLDALMGDLENFANDDRHPLPVLLKIALIHYQFETIHPFLDGNGRLGRLLITTYLVDRKVLGSPILYLSAFLERNRQEYYLRLSAVRENNDLLGWLHFFLRGVEEVATDGVATFRAILELERQMPARLQSLRSRAANAQRIVQYLFQQPVFTSNDLEGVLDVTPATLYRLINDLEALGIIHPIPTPGRPQYYGFTEYINLFR